MHPTAKITKEQADEIRKLFAEIKERMDKIKSYGLSPCSLTYIKQGKTYKDL